MDNSLHWMNYSIEIADKALNTNLKIGIVLVVNNNQIFSTYNDEFNSLSWADVLLKKIKEVNIKKAEELYLTINSINNTTFELSKLLAKIQINKIYIGLPDPCLNQYIQNDPILQLNNIYRYPDTLQQKILSQNSIYYNNSVQSIKQNQYYSSIRISKLVISKLKKYGFEISGEELKQVKSTSALAHYLENKYNRDFNYFLNLIQALLSEAFNEKYSSYNYSDDACSIDVNWWKNFMYVYRKTTNLNFENLNIINVGVGSGNEAITLFSNCNNITFVDIAKNGLQIIKAKIPQSIIHVSPAEKLSSIISDGYDLYVSLRTFNSSFFSTKNALKEAYRVIKNSGILIISVANGFLCSESKKILPGLIIPGTEFVDIYRGFSLVKILYKELIDVGFNDIRIYSSNSELYLTAKVYK